MHASIKIAAIQMVSSISPEINMQHAHKLVGEAAEQGAKIILLPEYWSILGRRDTDKLAYAEEPGVGPLQDFMSNLAREYGVCLIGGTIPLISSEPGKVLNTLLAYDAQGHQVARYDKMHLFGFTRGDESYDESRTITAGEDVVVLETPHARIGLAVCYDLRFPELFRAMQVCDLIVMPAAFTYTTGRAHWEILLRARAIENQCYVLAAAQGGVHENGRRTWGHSMLVDPWGEVQAELVEGEGFVIGDLDPAKLNEVRTSLPALEHRKLTFSA